MTYRPGDPAKPGRLFAEGPRFRTATLDPPWLERGGGKIKRGADRHYPLLPTPAIARVVRASGLWNLEDDAHVYCWVTDNFLVDGLRVLGELGVRYVRTIVWVKQRDGKLQRGLGQYFRGAHELCLFGVVGRGQSPDVMTSRRDLPSVLCAERGRHSAKPDAFVDLVEARSRGPYVEFFARSEREGWTSWGNEIAGEAAQ